MFSAIRPRFALRSSARAFSTTRIASSDLSKLTLIGRLGKDPEVRRTKSDQEYVMYTVATTNYPPPPPNPDGTRREAGTTWHTVLSFHSSSNNYLKTLSKGSRVYVEANFELRQPDPTADPDSPQGQRQIFLRHETLRLLSAPPRSSDSGEQ
ncbi:nucleic acid-binding protein [Neolentinus lepideus HHB14362 ss-1]|uniref:Nucleic acid-binding protein n=1 Tax=Neolentinus lepideus HHB14362 ss-1 TaxID=1314782 RepID=A0A165TQW8_9AGAM|nr:nucleic acid-binding protein [Neolentinus lepideus HHB14362 ss-1]